MVGHDDGSRRSLAEKVLSRPRVVAQIRALIPDPRLCHLVPYSTSSLERDVALVLGIPLYGADPDLLPFGTKTGCRRLFAAADVLHPLGREDIRDVDGLVEALVEMRAKRPAMRYAIVKLNDGVSGRGNATVDLAELRLRARPTSPPSSAGGSRGWRSSSTTSRSRATSRSSRATPASSRNGSWAPSCAARACNCA